MGLRSHGYWLEPTWPHAEFLFLSLGLQHQIWYCLRLAPSTGGRRGSSGTSYLPTRPRPLRTPWWSQIGSAPLVPSSRASLLPTVCPLLSVVLIGLKILWTRIASLPAGEKQGGAGDTGPWFAPFAGGSQAALPTSDPPFPHSCSLVHSVTRWFAHSLTP